MDYCSSCRRHLNGALVCPGCGAYAPDIAPSAVGGPTVSALPGTAATATSAWETPADDTWYDGYFRDEAAPAAGMDETDAPLAPAADVEGVPAAPQGRAARRRQRARWKKNQRRAVVATAVALVGGGLTVSAMDRGAGDKAQAATAPENPKTATAEHQATELTRPASTPQDTHRSPRTAATPPSHLTPTNASHPQSVPDERTAPQVTRPDAAATPTAAATPAPQSQAVTPASRGTDSGDSSGTTAEQQQTPAPSATEGSDTGTSTSPSSPAPEETSPAQLCVLNLVCL
ncbi:SCO2400 family protein [Streptomyces sp. SD31]|uniref:SCO2400 family protein n=1 Tax=Streptomyces sp. SD31 TaxID=3452208 RepID=UPI003F8BC778